LAVFGRNYAYFERTNEINWCNLFPVTDTPREDLLTHFEDTCGFIKAGQEQGVVLVHW
jgi:hypothetical protein